MTSTISAAGSQSCRSTFSSPRLTVARKAAIRLLSISCLMSLGFLPVVLKPKPALAAEAIKVSYGPLEFSLSIDSLETFAETGELTKEFEFFAQFLDEQSLVDLRRFLQRRFDVNPIVVSQLSYSSIGEQILQSLGDVIQTEGRLNGFYALRSALLLAATDPEGLSVINIIRRFPTDSIRVSANQLFALEEQFSTLTDYQNAAVRAVTQNAQTEGLAESPADFSQRPDLRQPGDFQVTQRHLMLNRDRQSLTGERITRQFTVDVYLPEGLSQPAPVIVVSHGLGSSPNAFAYLGEHLASHGFVAVIPQHIGSDSQRREAVLEGLLSAPVNPVEFLDRPLDISHTLDELDRLSQIDETFAGRMNLQQVGAIGHSFGGYTALALGGATLNHDRLSQTCTNGLTLNASPFLQCLAERLPDLVYPLQDSRVKATIAISPLDSYVFGPEGMSKIEIPTMIIGGSQDYVASVVQEQIHPFLWLTTPEKYLALMIPSGHTFADNTDGGEDPLPDTVSMFLSGPDPSLAREHMEALSLAFMQVYLGDRPDYQAYLGADYARFISQDPIQLDFIRSLTAEQLEQAYGKTPPLPIVPELALVPTPQRSSSILNEIAETGVLKAGIRQDAAPFGYVNETGQWTGFCVDLLDSLTTQLQQQLGTPVQLEIIAQSTVENRFALVRSRTVNVECGPNTIQNGIPGITFSTPFFLTGTQFLVGTDIQAPINPLGDLTGTRIGVLAETTTEQFLQQRYPDAGAIEFAGVNGRAEGVQAAIQGEIDAFASDGILLVAEAIRQNIPSTAYTLLPSGPLSCDPYGMILPADDREWQDAVNTFIASPDARRVWDQWFSAELYPYIFLSLDFCANQ